MRNTAPIPPAIIAIPKEIRKPAYGIEKTLKNINASSVKPMAIPIAITPKIKLKVPIKSNIKSI